MLGTSDSGGQEFDFGEVRVAAGSMAGYGTRMPIDKATSATDTGQNLIVSGSLARAVVRLAWPVFVSMGLHTLFHIVDSIWVGRLGADALAAVTTCIYATWILSGLGELIGTGLVAVAARHVGAGHEDRGRHAAAQALWLAALLGLLLAVLSPFLPKLLFQALETTPAVSDAGVRYLSLLFLYSFPLLLMMTLAAWLRAWGNTRVAMSITAAAVGTNLILDPLFIFGWGPIPPLGVSGAALATVLSQLLGALAFIVYFLSHPKHGRSLRLNLRHWDVRTMRDILRIGAPVTLNASFYALVYLAFSRVAAQMGTESVATLGVGNRLESISYILAESLSMSVAAVVGQNIGAGHLDRARRAGWITIGLGTAVTGMVGVVLFFFGENIFAAFTDDPAILSIAPEYMRILSLCQAAMGIEVVLYGVFAGAGFTAIPTLISSTINVIRIPLAFLVALTWGFGLLGLAWMITATCLVRAILLMSLFRRGKWLGTPL